MKVSLEPSKLSSTTLKPANGEGSPTRLVPVEISRNKRFHIEPKDVQVRFDPVVAFNELVTGLFLGSPPWCMEHLGEAAEVTRNYLEVAEILKGSNDIDGYYRYAQAGAFLKKYEGMPAEDVDEAARVAVDRWYAAEALNRKKNEELWDLSRKPLTNADNECWLLIQAVRREILQVIGEFPPEYADVAAFGRFGPGVSLTHGATQTDPILKCIDPSALESQREEVSWLMRNTLFTDVVCESRTGMWRGLNSMCKVEKYNLAMEGVEWVDYERLSTVPKDLWKRRSIGVGASLATWIQQSYDGWLRERLKTIGIDLSNQDPNRSLAFLGSIPGRSDLRPATIDLTDASSRICFGLIPLLFSGPWARTLVRQRAKFCIVNGKRERMEMFSAMGNALTFSLQTLIFSAVVRSVLRDHGMKDMQWRVYGDDIIVPGRIFDDVCHSLELLGFEPNRSKSYGNWSPFRESCGADYLHGTNVRPLFLKSLITDVSEAYKVLNLISAFAAESPIPAWSYRRVWKYLLSTVPEDFRVFGEPSEVLDFYIWAPVRDLPGWIPRKVIDTENLPEQWAYRRTLLIKDSSDSHIREGRGYYDAFELYRKIRVSGNRAGLIASSGEWKWIRLGKFQRARPKGLRDALKQLFS